MRTSAHSHAPGRTVAVLALIVAALLLAGCSGSTQQTTAEKDTSGGSAPGTRDEAPEGGQNTADDGAGDGGSVAGSNVDVREREVVHTAQLTVETNAIEKTADSAKEWVDDVGGHVASESVTSESDEGPRASLTLRVPTGDYEDALTELGSLGTQADLQREVKDVTEEVADVDSRVESAEASLDRLRDLVREAEDVEDVLAVETEISSRQEELEALQARQQALQDSTSFGTIELSLLPPDTYLAEDRSESIGFTGGLLRGWRALVAVAQGAAVVLGWLLPFLAVVAVAAVPVVVWRRRQTAATTNAAAEATDGPAPDLVGTPEGTGDSDASDGEQAPERDA